MSNSAALLSPGETVACCALLSRAPLSRSQAEQVASLLKALADPVRLRLLSLVPGTRFETWDTDEPSERGIDGIERMRLIRDDIARRVDDLHDRLTPR